MSTISAEINSLATVTVIDIYRRHVRKDATDRHYLWASRAATAFWGLYAVAFAGFGKNLGSLIEAVNMLGSLFYGSLLGVFVLAFFFPRVRGTRRLHRHAGRRGGHLRRLGLHRHLLPLVQRDRLPGGPGYGARSQLFCPQALKLSGAGPRPAAASQAARAEAG